MLIAEETPKREEKGRDEQEMMDSRKGRVEQVRE
jgi:hypothetical protein